MLHVTLVVDLDNLDKVREWGIDPSLGSESAGVAVRFHLILVSHTTLSTEDTHSFRNYQKATLQLEGAILLLHPITYCPVMSTSRSTSSITIVRQCPSRLV